MKISPKRDDGNSDLSRREEGTILMEIFYLTKKRKMEKNLSWPRHEEVWLTFFEREKAKRLQSSSCDILQQNIDIDLTFALVGLELWWRVVLDICKLTMKRAAMRKTCTFETIPWSSIDEDIISNSIKVFGNEGQENNRHIQYVGWWA